MSISLRDQWLGNVRGDVLSGLVVALALIPEAIAFSIIAGVDPKVGLYASFSIATIIAFAGGRPGMISAATGAMALLMITLVGFLLVSTTALLPTMVQTLFGYPVVTSGQLMMPRGIGMMMAMMAAGQLVGRGVDPRLMLTAGFTITGAALWGMSLFSPAQGAQPFVITGFFQGAGLGLIFVPLNTMAFASLPMRLRHLQPLFPSPHRPARRWICSRPWPWHWTATPACVRPAVRWRPAMAPCCKAVPGPTPSWPGRRRTRAAAPAR